MLTWLQTHPALQSNRLVPVAVVLAFLAAASAAGVVVASGNLLLLGVAVGAILGVLLLNHLHVAVWLILVGTLLVSGPLIMHVPALGRLQWGFSMLGFFLIGAAIIVAGIDRTPHRPRTPGFVWAAAAFMMFAIAALPMGPTDSGQWAGAIKRYFQFFGLMFVLAAMPFSAKVVRRWLMFLLFLAVVQLPFALYQKIVLVPLRHNMPRGVVPVDIVAGTLEADMFGAGNNIGMALLLVALLAGVLAAYRDGLLRGSVTALLSVVIAAPLALGETKTVLVILPLALLVVFADLVRKRPIVFAMGSVAVATAVAGLFYVYVALQPTDARVGLTFQQRLEENIEYNFGSRGYSPGMALNRGNAVPFWWSRNGLDEPVGTLVGYGLGASFGVDDSDAGVMSKRYPGQGIGLTGMSALLWDVGIVGTLLYTGMLAGGFLTARRLAARAPPGLDRVMCRGLAASALMFLALLWATDTPLMLPSTQVMMFTTLGLIAWRARYPAAAQARG